MRHMVGFARPDQSGAPSTATLYAWDDDQPTDQEHRCSPRCVPPDDIKKQMAEERASQP